MTPAYMLFRRKKYGAKPVKEIGGKFALYPFISTRRSESVIYFTKEIDLEAIEEYMMEKKEKGVSVSLFPLLVCAISKTFYKKPLLNRFMLGKRLYQRDRFNISYIARKSMTEAGQEFTVNLEIPSRMSPAEVQEKMTEIHENLKQSEETSLDRLMKTFASFPKFFLNIVFFILRRLDNQGLIPKALRNELPFYACVCISNIGSLGSNPPFHHLYEVGTTSLFIAMGKPEPRLYSDPVTNEIKTKKVLPLKLTADERICDGFYLARSMATFVRYASNPKSMERPD